MSHRATVKRIMRESKDMIANPANGIIAHPLENVFIWHFTIAGVSETEFEGGRYHGKIILPSEYPFKPPDIMMLTKSGRFEIGRKICLNFSGFHPEQWQPSWTIRTMLVALRAFMVTPAAGAIGAMETSHELRKRYAKLSLNYTCPKCNANMKTLKFAKMDDKNDTKVKESLDMRKNQKKNDKKGKKDKTKQAPKDILNDDNDENDESEDSLDLANVSDSDDDDDDDNGDDDNDSSVTTTRKSGNDNGSNSNGNNNSNTNGNSNSNDNNNQTRENNNRNANRNRSDRSESSIQSSPNAGSTKNKVLDALSITLLFAILAILLKKFLVRFVEQL